MNAPELRRRYLPALSATTLLIALSTTFQAAAYTKIPAKTVHSCNNTGQCKDTYYPEFPNAGACTRFLRQWSRGTDNDNYIEACTDFMGINKFCADQDAYVVIGYTNAPGTWNGTSRVLKCSPNYHSDSIGDQFIHIWTGIGQGLLTAAPFVGEGVLAGACVYGQLYACAVLALEVSEQAGLAIPGEIGDAVYIAGKAPECIDGDVVACAYLGARGAKAVGLEIPGVPAIAIFDDSRKCSDGDFPACVRLGREAADAGGVEIGSSLGSAVDAQDCLDGRDEACIELGKEAAKGIPLGGVPNGVQNAQACNEGSTQDCIALGKTVASAASGLIVAAPLVAPFGVNVCTSVSGTKGTADLASAWDDYGATSIAVFPSDGTHFGAPFHASNRKGGWAATAKWAAADFTGDGATDMLAVWDDNGNNTFTLRQSTDFGFTISQWAIRAGTWANNSVWLPGDFDGDGHMDIAGVWKDQDQTSIAVYLSDGARFKAPTQWTRRGDGGWVDLAKWTSGDFNGDGKTDIAAIWNHGGSNTITIRQSTGSGFVPAHWATNAGGWNEESVWLAGDFNGDGRLDLAGVWHDGSAVSIAVYPSNGSQFQGWSQWSQHHGSWIGDAKWTVGDFNGDGMADIASTWNEGGSNTITVRQSTGSSFVDAHWARSSGGWSPSAAWCVGHFPHSVTVSKFDDQRADHSALYAAASPAQLTTVKALGRVHVDGAAVTALPSTPMSICGAASEAAARNSPAAPGLKQQCQALGGALVLDPPLDAATLDSLAVKGGPIAAADPLSVALRAQQLGDAGQRGFNVGMAAAENQTAPGPGKQHIYNSLAREEKTGYDVAVSFSLERNRNADLAGKGAAIDIADPTVAAARNADASVFYQLGFDIASGIFGDPALGALGHTLTGPGSEKIRDSLSANGQRGFNASVAFHLARNYKR